MKKKIKVLILFMVILFTFSGCSIEKINDYDYETMMDKILSMNVDTYNKIGKGYKYYAPKGVVLIDSNQDNDVLIKENITYYLYVDVIRYYYKSKMEYKEKSNAYFSKAIDYKGKKGYIEITKSKNKLYVVMEYNYAKIESYVEEKNLKSAIIDMSYILTSMNFNDALLKKMYESGNLTSKDEAYKLFDNKEKEGNFLEYIKEYDKYDEEDAKEDAIIENNISTTTTTMTETTNQTTEAIIETSSDENAEN